MKPYSVEIFDRDFNFIDHNVIDDEDFDLSIDYLDPENNKISIIAPCAGDINDYIRIIDNGAGIWGIITKKDISKVKDKGTITYTFKEIEDILDIDTVIDTDLIGIGTLENYLAERIKEVYVTNADVLENINGLTVDVLTDTEDWELDLTSDSEDDHYTKAKLLDDIILPAFKKYSVRCLFGFDIKTKTIKATVSVNDKAIKTIETALPNVLSSTILYQKVKKEVNKDIICNKKHYETSVIYYLHSDGSFDTEDTDRIKPVVRKLETVSTKTADEWADKWAKTLTSANNKISSIQSKLDKGDEVTEDDIEDELEAAGYINQMPGVSITIDEETGSVIKLLLSTVKITQKPNAEGGYTVIIEDTFDNSTDSYSRTANLEGGETIRFTNLYPDEVAYTKEDFQQIIDTYATTEKYLKQCAGFAYDEFIEKAYVKAAKTFASNKYENNIKVECLNDDTLINPMGLEIGQLVNVIDGGEGYKTILTGKKIKSGKTTLIFGNSRIELTKYLKGRQ